MGKYKMAICPKCGKKINRHDANRANIKVGQGSNHQGVFKNYHLTCFQEIPNN